MDDILCYFHWLWFLESIIWLVDTFLEQTAHPLKQGPPWERRSRPVTVAPAQCRDLSSGCRARQGIVMKAWEGGALNQRGLCLLLNTVWPFPQAKCSVWERFAIWKGGFYFLHSPANLNFCRSQGRLLVQYNKETFSITASFSECVSYVNAASEPFPSSLHFNSAFKTCKIETQRKTPWKYFGFHLFSIFTSGSPHFF